MDNNSDLRPTGGSPDERVRLTVMGLSYSQIQSGAYALILAQADGPYRIPVVIGAAEAQSIALRMESITPPRPMTHDLFVSFAHAFGVKLMDVFIYRFADGIFSSELRFSDGTREVTIDSRTSDAIAIVMRTRAPIYTTRAILEETGFIMEGREGDRDEAPDHEPEREPRPENMALEELERTLARLIAEERYEEAAHISAIIKDKKSKQ